MNRTRLPLTAVLPDARDRHRSAPVLPTPRTPAPRETSPYRLPDGRVVLVYEDVARGAASVTYEMIRTADGERVIVDATRVTATPKPVWCQQLAQDIVTTVNEWAADGASEAQLVACVADLLEEDLPALMEAVRR